MQGHGSAAQAADAGAAAAGAYEAGGLHIAPLDLGGRAVANGVGFGARSAGASSSLDSEGTYGDALLGSSAPSPSTVLPLHPAQARCRLEEKPLDLVQRAAHWLLLQPSPWGPGIVDLHWLLSTAACVWRLHATL